MGICIYQFPCGTYNRVLHIRKYVCHNKIMRETMRLTPNTFIPASFQRGLVAIALAATACLSPAHAAKPDAAALQPGEHQAVVNGVRLWYKVAGKTSAGVPPLLFLHGGPGYNSYSFEVQAGRALEAQLPVIYLDQRGSGRSERPWRGDYTIAGMVEDIEALRKSLGVPELAIMGHSFGGTLALEYAATYPQHVANMVLIGAASDIPAACAARVDFLGKRYAAELAQARAAAKQRNETPDDCFFAFNSIEGEARERANDETMFPDMRQATLQHDIDAKSGLRNTGELGGAIFNGDFMSYRFAHPERLTMPVLVIAGAEDYAIGLPAQRALGMALPKARVLEYPGAGHFPYVDAPQRFTRDVAAFLRAGL
jgi:proline iminopeptidase